MLSPRPILALWALLAGPPLAAAEAPLDLSPPAQAADAQALASSPTADALEGEAVRIVSRRLDRSALKLPQTERETPRSLTVIGADEIRDRGLKTVNEAFDQIPGVFNNSYNTGAYHFYSRGYRMQPSDTRVDGFTGMNDGGGYNQSLFGIERVVFLRGPAGLLYGATSWPGGMVNLVTKQPEPMASVSLDQRLASFAGQGVGFGARSSYTADLDATGPLELGKPGMLYRLLYQSENQDHHVANNLRRSQSFQLDLAWELDPNTRIRTHLQRLSYRRPAVSNLVSPSTSQSQADGKDAIVTSDLNGFNVNLAAGGRSDEHFVAGFDLSRRLGGGLALAQSYRYRDFDTEINQWTVSTATLAQAVPADERSWRVQRQQARSHKERWNHNLDLSLTQDLRPGAGWKNLVLAGVNAQYAGTDRDDAAPTGAAQSWVNIYTGIQESAVADTAVLSTRNPLAKDLQWNLYLQDQLSLLDDLLVLTAGLGYGEQNISRDYTRASSVPPANLGAINATRRGQLTPNAALLYNLTRSLGLYASYATSYLPPNGEYEDATGKTGAFAPQTGVNYEVGFKFESPRRAYRLSVDAYWNEMTNTLRQTDAGVLNANGNRYYIQAQGEGLLSRGGELSAELRPVDGFELKLGSAYVDASNRTSTFIPGALPQKTPRWSFNGSTRYDIQGGPLKGLGASLGLQWQAERNGGDRTTANTDPLVMPAYARLDAGLFYKPGGDFDLALNIDNLTDELIFVGGTTGASIEAAAPRSVSLRLGYKL